MRIVLKTVSAPKPILAQNVPTYGHEHSQSIVDKGSERMTTDETAAAVLRCVGGKANVLGNSLCMTRLRLSVANPTLVDREGINSIAGVLGTTTRGANGIEVVFGPRVVQEVFDSFEALTGLDSTNEKMPPSTGFTPSNLRVHINPNHGEAEHDATELARELDSIASRGDDTGEHDLEDLTQMLLDSEPEPSAQTDDSLYDEDGKLWMSYGSWSGGIWMLELDENTGLRDYDVEYTLTGAGDGVTVDPYFGKKVAGGFYVSGEASYIEHIGNYYFLFVTYGGLAAGGVASDYNNGGYQMRVFRSEKPDGPYLDTEGKDAIFQSFMVDFGPQSKTDRGVNIFGAYGDWGNMATGNLSERSQGHNSILAAEDGRTYLVYHTRFQNSGENHQVRVHQVFQNQDGWLVAAPFEYTGEQVKSADIATSQQIATAQVPGGYKLLIHKYRLNHTTKELVTPVEIQLNADGSISGSQSGTWSINEGTSYITITLGSTVYKGVMVEQNLENKTFSDDKTPAFTALADDGVTIWGYKYSETTGISQTLSDNIRQNGAIYDMQGRRVNNPQRKGIYIQNGKKYIVK